VEFNPTRSNGTAYLYSLVVLVAITLVFHWLNKRVWKRKQRTAGEESPRFQQGLWPLIVGADGRTSTSKVQLVLWTYAFFWALAALLFIGAERFADAFNEQFQAEYLFLLGAPATAAVVAKYLTSSRVARGELVKPQPSEGETSLLGAIVTDDNNRGDLGDFQYFGFNVLALAYFLSIFVQNPVGLPSLPPTLVGLTSASALVYISKKSIERQIRTLSAVLPSQAAPKEPVELRGVNLFVDGENEANLRVRFGATDTPAKVQPDTGGAVITTTVPEDAPLGKTNVTVVTASGATTNSREFEVIAGGPQITAVEPDPIVLRPGATVTIDGKGFFAPGDQQAPTGHNQVALDGHQLQSDPADWSSTQVRARLPETDADLAAAGWTAGTGQLVARDSWGRPSAARQLKLAAPSAEPTTRAPAPAAAVPTVPYVVQPGEHLLMIAERLFIDNGVAAPAPADVSRLAAQIAELNAGQLSGPTLVKENHAIQVPGVIPTPNGAGRGPRP
jgi:hypothetical protein